jgi:hypothetical protein
MLRLIGLVVYWGDKLCERYLKKNHGIHLYFFELPRTNFRKDRLHPPCPPFLKPSDDLLKLPNQFPKSGIIFQMLLNDF